MPETLIVDNTNVDVRGELLPGDPGIHWFVAVVVVARSKKLIAEVFDRCVFFSEPVRMRGIWLEITKRSVCIETVNSLERCCILRKTVHGARLTRHALD